MIGIFCWQWNFYSKENIEGPKPTGQKTEKDKMVQACVKT